MRELKFRAWHRKLKEWHYWNLIDLPGMETQTQIVGGKAMKVYKMDYTYWGQYVGLKDKNDKDIYEGDILKTDSGLNQFVEYRNDMAMFVCRFKNGASTNISVQWEIIGNIYENPELIK